MQEFKNYYDTNQFALLANVSIKTVGRLKKELLANNSGTDEVYNKRNRNYYHYSLLKKFMSADMYELYRLEGLKSSVEKEQETT